MASRRTTLRCASCRETYWSDEAHRCEAAKPRRWRKVGPHEYTLRMGPVLVEVDWYRYLSCGEGEWTYRATVGAEGSKATILSGSQSAPLSQCQADAIAAGERWRDGIR